MTQPTTQQSGSALTIAVIGVLMVALIGALGYIFWNQLNDKDSDTTKTADTTSSSQTETPTPQQSSDKYVDYRTDGDATGMKLKSASDVSMVSDASDKLKSFYTSKLPDTTFIVDRVYGNYGVGSQSDISAYVVWGPKDGTGAITNVAGTQNIGFSCDELKAADVPSELVDGKCSDGQGVVSYQ